MPVVFDLQCHSDMRPHFLLVVHLRVHAADQLVSDLPPGYSKCLALQVGRGKIPGLICLQILLVPWS